MNILNFNIAICDTVVAPNLGIRRLWSRIMTIRKSKNSVIIKIVSVLGSKKERSAF